ncbi:hypothetical protein YC2023_049322 [Brassica napus]
MNKEAGKQDMTTDFAGGLESISKVRSGGNDGNTAFSPSFVFFSSQFSINNVAQTLSFMLLSPLLIYYMKF